MAEGLSFLTTFDSFVNDPRLNALRVHFSSGKIMQKRKADFDSDSDAPSDGCHMSDSGGDSGFRMSIRPSNAQTMQSGRSEISCSTAMKNLKKLRSAVISHKKDSKPRFTHHSTRGLLIRSRHVGALSTKATFRHRHFGHGTRLPMMTAVDEKGDGFIGDDCPLFRVVDRKGSPCISRPFNNRKYQARPRRSDAQDYVNE